jgi:hypothetical protein
MVKKWGQVAWVASVVSVKAQLALNNWYITVFQAFCRSVFAVTLHKKHWPKIMLVLSSEFCHEFNQARSGSDTSLPNVSGVGPLVHEERLAATLIYTSNVIE